VQVRQFQTGLDLHAKVVILRLQDDSEGGFDFSFDPAVARDVGEALIAWATQAANATKPIKQ
jgi:hypothetical protein